MSEFVLSCAELSKSYHDGVSDIKVLQKVELQVKAGEMVSIVGSSGSGKSTLLHLLGGLDKPTSGRVQIAEQDLSTLSEQQKCQLRNRYLGFIYQFHHLLGEFTALENVGMPLLIAGMHPAVIRGMSEDILEKVGLKERLTHKVGELSGGERQRVAIARALVTKPLCILADEPTGNLDPRNAEKVLELFVDLQKMYKTSVVLVTHDRHIACQAHKMLVLREGMLVVE